jgi:rod shape-determining protein MreD
MRRTLAIFLTSLILWAVLGRLNDALSPARVTIFAGGLFVAYAAFTLPFAESLAASLLAGAVLDACAPVWFGTHALLLAGATALIFALRERLPHDQAAGRVGIALAANAAIFLALSAAHLGSRAAAAGIWPRLASDLLLSELFIALAAPWFFALQEQTLRYVPREPDGMF